MRASRLVRVTGIAAGIAALETAPVAQPQQLYTWPNNSLHGRTVLDASVGRGFTARSMCP